MKKKSISKILIIVSVILLLLSIFCISMGFNKMLRYKNSNESYSYKNINAYVGGDAYNYIINACYFAGYVSLGGCLLITSSIFTISGIKNIEAGEKKENYSI